MLVATRGYTALEKDTAHTRTRWSQHHVTIACGRSNTTIGVYTMLGVYTRSSGKDHNSNTHDYHVGTISCHINNITSTISISHQHRSDATIEIHTRTLKKIMNMVTMSCHNIRWLRQRGGSIPAALEKATIATYDATTIWPQQCNDRDPYPHLWKR